MAGHLIVTDEDATRVITLRRPEKKNAINQEMYRAMSDAIDTAQHNPAIRCMIITGGSGVFTAGNDLEDFLKDGTSSAETSRASNATKFLYSLAHNTKPIIAAVDGVAHRAIHLLGDRVLLFRPPQRDHARRILVGDNQVPGHAIVLRTQAATVPLASLPVIPYIIPDGVQGRPSRFSTWRNDA